MTAIVVFEDGKADNFLPLTYTRAVFDLRVGMHTFLERVKRALGGVDGVFVRGYLVDVYKERLQGARVNPESFDEKVLFVNGRLLLTGELAGRIKEKVKEGGEFAVFKGEEPLAVYATPERAAKLAEALAKGDDAALASLCRDAGEKLEAESVKVVEYPWNLVHLNTEQIAEDFTEYAGREWEGEVDERAVVYGDRKNVFIAKGARVEAFAVIDARHGPVYIGEGTRVAPGALIEGPTYIGRDTLIVAHALIREGSNIGDVCRVGGEVEESIIHGYSNKYHAGFLGHAYVGEWVNLGALTTNSDLKDTYGTVKVTVRGKRVDTGSRKVGCFIGDMAKTSIGTLIYTGKKIGISSHLHGVVYEDVPSFTIYAKSLGAKPVEIYIDSAVEIQRRMMSRRGRELTTAEEELIRRLFELTAEERRKAGVEKGRFRL